MRVLIAEDETVSRRLLEASLEKWGYQVVVTRNGSEAWEILQQPDAPSMILSDWMMPVMDGLELCAKVRRMDRSDYIYFIIVTGKGDREDIVKGLNAGADDYLTKPLDQEELRCRVMIGKRIIQLERRILQLASTDPLTGILNRRAFMDQMEGQINRCSRENAPLSLIMADIDHFKKVNDTHGHQAGDAVLQHFAERLSGSLRSYDFLGRYGGEEFTICLPGTDSNMSGLIAERLRGAVEEAPVILPDNACTVHVTASFGVAARYPEPNEGVDLLIGMADEALYRAKAGGRNCVCMAI